MQIIEVAAIKIVDINSPTDWERFIVNSKVKEWIAINKYGIRIISTREFIESEKPVTVYVLPRENELTDFDRSKLKLHQSGTAFSNAWAGMITDFSDWVKRKIK